jgi:hypothetical protein
MKWRILLELTEATGSVQTRKMITGSRPTNATSPETIGLTLGEGKSLLAAMQTQLVQARTDGYCQHRRKCVHCGSRRSIKDWRTRLAASQVDGVFGSDTAWAQELSNDEWSFRSMRAFPMPASKPIVALRRGARAGLTQSR